MANSYPKPPDGLITLQEAAGKVDQEVNIMGIVTECLAPSMTRGTDYQMTFELTDPSMEGSGWMPMSFKFFRKDLKEFPKIRGVGDVLLLRRIKMTAYMGELVALASYDTRWTVFPAKSIPVISNGHFAALKNFTNESERKPNQLFERYACVLCNSRDRATFYQFPHALPGPEGSHDLVACKPSGRDKFSLLEGVQVDKFYDLVGQVVRTYHTGGNCLEIYFTDYTSNDNFFNYTWNDTFSTDGPRDGDPHGYVANRKPVASKPWPGPWGSMTLQVSLFEPHWQWFQKNVSEGDNILLKNVRIKFGRSGVAQLEGSMHTDQKYSDRVGVSIIEDRENERVTAMLKRKRAYEKKFRKQKESYARNQSGENKRKGSGEDDYLDPRGKARSKKARKGKRQESKYTEDQTLEPSSPATANKRALNPQIKTTKPNIRPTPLSDIIDGKMNYFKTPDGIPYRLPFQNICYRSTVRVVDFFPPDLIDFAFARGPLEFMGIDSASDDTGSEMSESDSREMEWGWCFELLLEDGQSRPQAKSSADPPPAETLRVSVRGDEAAYLLNLDAADLRKNPELLDQLRERLFLLWGDLEEVKRADREAGAVSAPLGERTSSRPFRCCLKEYGTKSRARKPASKEEDETFGWTRQFRMFGTTIG